jgi:hypothetical protein
MIGDSAIRFHCVTLRPNRSHECSSDRLSAQRSAGMATMRKVFGHVTSRWWPSSQSYCRLLAREEGLAAATVPKPTVRIERPYTE